VLNEISNRFDVFTALAACGVDHEGRRRIACPVHGGSGLNFSIHDNGSGWTCHSRHCGEPNKRDGVNLFCLLRYGAPLPKLSNKAEALRQLCDLTGLDYSPQAKAPEPVNRFDTIPLIERQGLAAIFADTARLAPDDLGQSCLYSSNMAQRVILFLACAKGMNQLPVTVTRDWPEYENLERYCHAK